MTRQPASAQGPVRAVLFDLSYTLLTNGRTEAFHEGLKAAGRDLSVGDVHVLLGRSDGEFARRHPERRGMPVHRWIEDYVDVVAGLLPAGPAGPRERAMILAATRPWAASGGGWRVYDDVVPALGQLRAAGIRTAIVSNWGPSGHRVLRQAGLDRLADAIVLSGDVGTAKPDPRIFLTALRRLGVEAAEAVMVGDNYGDDIEGAGRAGLRGILLDRYGLPGSSAVPCALARSLRGVVQAALAPASHLPPPAPAASREAPAPARASASVVIVRPGRAGPEVLLGTRAPSGTLPGVAVFPGGEVREEDRGAAAEVDGPGAPPVDLAFRRAALRETFEETGIWLGGPPRPGQADREALLRGETPPRFRNVAAEEAAGLADIGWLETPPHLPNRYHTRFYVTSLPAGEIPDAFREELADLMWLRPEDALAEGGPRLLLPTRGVLRRLCGFVSADSLLAAARASGGGWISPRASLPELP